MNQTLPQSGKQLSELTFMSCLSTLVLQDCVVQLPLKLFLKRMNWFIICLKHQSKRTHVYMKKNINVIFRPLGEKTKIRVRVENDPPDHNFHFFLTFPLGPYYLSEPLTLLTDTSTFYLILHVKFRPVHTSIKNSWSYLPKLTFPY